MDKQERLTNLLRQVSEYKEVMVEASDNCYSALRSKEYSFLERSASILVKSQSSLADLDVEVKQLREAIEEEAKEIIL